MEDSGAVETAATIFKVLADNPSRCKIFDYVPIKDLVRSEVVSKQWQRAVLGYLQEHYALTLNIWKSRRLFDGPKHRTVSVPRHVYTKTIDKLGPSTVGVLTDRDEIFENLDSKCPRLKSLSLIACNSLVFHRLLCTSYLPNITNLELERMTIKTLTKVHVLLDNMPRVESVTLRSNNLVSDEYNNANISKEFIGCFSRLAHLRRLKMELVFAQTDKDALLEALAGCKRLEWLDIAGDKLTRCGRGLAALIRRSPAAVTSLHFEQDVTSRELEDLFKDLEVHGCGDMMEDVRVLREQITPMEFKLGGPNVEDIELHPKLKITIGSVRLYDDIELQDVWDTEEPATSTTDSSTISDWHGYLGTHGGRIRMPVPIGLICPTSLNESESTSDSDSDLFISL